MTTMYDSTTAGDIPETAEAVAGYVNGNYAWSDADWARFTAATLKREISVSALNQGDTLDIEKGDATADQAPGWVAKRVASGMEEAELWLYVNLDNWPQLKEFMGPRFAGGYWVADWTGEEHELEGAAAVQYANPDTSGGHYDLSVIATAPAPAPGPEPEPGGFDLSTVPDIQEGSTGDVVKTWQSILNGRASAGLAVDGIFGPQTKLKTQEWQDVFHLATDGIVGPQTWGSAFA